MTFPPVEPHTANSQKWPARILIVRLSAHGDVIHTLPLLAALKQHAPHTRIGWLVEASALPLLAGHPEIDHLHVSHRKDWLKRARNPLNWPAVWEEVAALLQELRQADYQVSLDVQGLLKSALWPFWVKIPRRFGFRQTREFADWLYTDKLPYHDFKNPKMPVIERFLDFARVLGASVDEPSFTVPPVSEGSRQKVAALLSDTNTTWPLVVLAPFTRWESKHWRPDYWVEILSELLNQPVRVAILGAPSDRQATEAMLAQLPHAVAGHQVMNWVGQTDWPDLYALFEQTRLLIGLDSAPLHIANAVGVPEIIGLYGPTAVGRTGPIGRQHSALSTALSCQPCHERHCPLKTQACMQQLTPVVVLAMVRQHLLKPDVSKPVQKGNLRVVRPDAGRA